jgi:beta-lactamase class D
MDRFVSPLLSLFDGLRRRGAETQARPEWQKHFDAHGVHGTFALFEPATDRYLVVNEARARERFLPAATFDIANALIALEVGSIGDASDVFHWDRRPKVREAWERDHSLASGMRENVAWMFQEIARRTGREQMREWVDRLGYGNADIKGGIELFWLQGALRVSAIEQVDFLRKLSEGALAATQRCQRLVRESLVIERTRAYRLYAKSGACGIGKNAVWWWVGWVERRGRPAAVFAMNFTPARSTRAEHRLRIARAILEEAGALPHAPSFS